MAIYIGTSKASEFYIGASKVGEIYLGTDLVYKSFVFPEGYTQYDYLYSASASGGANVRITDLELNVSSTTVMELYMEGTGVKNVWGYTNSSVTNRRVWFNSSTPGFAATNTDTLPSPLNTKTTITIVYDNTNGTLSISDGTNTISGTMGSLNQPICIGNTISSGSGSSGKHRVYSCKIYDGNGKLIRDLVPAMNSSNESGFVNLAYKSTDSDTGVQFYKSSTEAAMKATNEV